MTKELLLQKIEEGYTNTQLKAWINSLPKLNFDRKSLSEKIKTPFTKEQLIEWVNEYHIDQIDNQTKMIEVQNVIKSKSKKVPTRYKKGDVLMHPHFRHPYVLLELKSNGIWLCGLLTSEETCPEILEKAKSRFFVDEYFTKVLFTVSDVIGSYMYPFDNGRQLTNVLNQLKNILK